MSNSTFNLPDFRGRVPLGMETAYLGKNTNGYIPNIRTYNSRIMAWFNDSAAELYDGPLYRPAGGGFGLGGASYINTKPVYFDAHLVNDVYDSNGWFDGTRVIPSSIAMLYCIKY